MALTMAQKAKEQFPDSPNISDTLGWIYYKKNIPGRAVTYLKEAAEKLPENPTIRYHLGMAYYKSGNRSMAQKELTQALNMGVVFPEADKARAALKELK